MKLGKRKADGDQAPEKPERKQSRKSPKSATGNRHKRLSAVSLAQVLAVVLSAVAAVALVWTLVLTPVEQQRLASQSAIEAAGAVVRVDQRLALLQRAVNGLAELPYLQQLAEDEGNGGEKPGLGGFMDGVQAVYVFPYGEVPRSVTSGSGLGFASLELARQAESGGSLHPDAFPRDGKWQIQFAAPIRRESGQALAGTLLVLFDAAVLAPALEPVNRELGGQLAVVQTVSGKQGVVASRGAGSGVPVEQALQVTDWSLRFTPAAVPSPLVNNLLVAVLVMVPAVVAAVVVWLLIGGAQSSLRKDVAALIQWSHKAFAGERSRQPELTWDLVAAMGDVLQRLSQVVEKRVSKGGSQSVRPAPGERDPMAAADEEPLFQDRDVLDVDMLEGDDDVLGFGGDSTPPPPSPADMMVAESQTVMPEVSQSIFRAYDIRGIVGETLTADIVQLIGRAIGSEALNRGVDTLCVGYDGRHSSPELASALARGVMATGCNVIGIGAVPTPVLYFATHHLETGSGVMITGSHNPANYNGLKMMLAGETLSGDAIMALYQRIQDGNLSQGQGARTEQDVRRAYLDRIVGDIAVAVPLKVVLDAGNGIAGELAPILVEELGCEVIPIHCEVDGSFPNHHPDPGKPENLQDLIRRVQDEQADIGLAFDGDGDRLGVVTNTGKIIWPDRLLMLFARDVVSRNPGADVLYDVKCSRRLAGVISEAGGRPIMWKTGHSLMKAKMKETGALLAGEMSGHIFFSERWYGFDDGLYSAARLLEILGVEGRPSSDVFTDFPEDVSTPELNVEVTDESKFAIVDRLSQQGSFGDGNVSTIDGIRVDYPDGWGLCRASNTTPVLVLRFEAETEQALERIKGIFREQLRAAAPDVVTEF